jgi:AcrR family transcriptional regulator
MSAAPRLSLRQEQKERTAARLVAAARQAFETSGYAATTVDEIVRVAGTSRGTFYLHFDSKAAALRAVLHELQLQEEYRILIEDFRAIAAPTVEELRPWVERVVDFIGDNRAIHRAMYEAHATDPAFARSLIDQFDDYGLGWETLAFVDDVDGADLRVGASLTFALMYQFVHLYFNGGLSIDKERAMRMIAEFMHLALRPACGCTCACCGARR